MNLPSFALRRPVTTLMMFVSVVMMGLLSTQRIPLELFPAFTEPQIQINIPYPGSTPEEVERQIARPAEEVLATLSGITRMSSNSNEGGANISLQFSWGDDVSLRAIEAKEKLDGIRHLLPADVERIYVQQESSTDMPILTLRISSDRDLSGAYDLLDRKLKGPIERLEGVSQVDLYGVNRREIRVELLADRVAAHRVDLVQLQLALQRSNVSVTAGRITDGERRLMVRPIGEITEAEAVRNLVINDTGVRLRDIAQVSYEDPELDHARHLNGTYAVGLNIMKESGANIVNTSARVDQLLAEMEGDPEMQGITVFRMGSSAEGITSSLSHLLESGLLGGVFALIVLYLFLGRISTTLIVVLAVPISILVTVGALYFMGLTLNILSMMGLMLAIGMLVDNAVVVTENIHRHQHLTPDDPVGATLRGVKEVALAVTAGTLTTAIVFLPMIVSPADEVTLFLKHVSIAICVALVTSLLISLTVVPLLTARLKPPPQHSASRIDRMTAWYGRMLDRLVRRRWVSAGLVVGTLASVVIPASLVTMDFFPDEDDARQMDIYYNLNGAYTLDRIKQDVDRVEAYLLSNKETFEIESVYTYYSPNWAVSTITLTEGDEVTRTSDELKEMMRDGLPKVAIGRLSFGWGGNDSDASVRLTLSGPSSQRLADLSYDLVDVLGQVEGLKDVRSEARQGDQEVRVVVDRDRARQYGLSTQQVAQNISAAMRGQNLRRLRTPDGEVEVRLQFQEGDRRTLEQLQTLPLQQADGNRIQLAALADVQVARGPRNIYRENRATMIGISASVEDGVTREEARERMSRVMERYELPTGYAWGYGQRFSDAEASQNIMLMNLLLALAMIYLVMAALFESLVHPAAIWSSILFAIIGVFWFFLVTNTVFSVMAWIGILVLVGVVVNNGIVLIDHINHLRGEGLTRHEAVVRGASERLRPIVMTAATTILGLIPLCIGNTQIAGDGPPYFPMARAIVGGLAFSTVVTLVILPAIYLMLDDLRNWGHRLAHQAAPR
ncbi:MAG: efflux RND transporter permease subunit [Bacteroidota bacterium]